MTSSSTKDADLVERLRAISYPNGSPQAEAADALEAAQARIAGLEAKLVGVMDAWENDQAKAKIALDQRDTAERERDEARAECNKEYTLRHQAERERDEARAGLHAAFCAGLHYAVGQRELAPSELLAARAYVEERVALAATPPFQTIPSDKRRWRPGV